MNTRISKTFLVAAALATLPLASWAEETLSQSSDFQLEELSPAASKLESVLESGQPLTLGGQLRDMSLLNSPTAPSLMAAPAGYGIKPSEFFSPASGTFPGVSDSLGTSGASADQPQDSEFSD